MGPNKKLVIAPPMRTSSLHAALTLAGVGLSAAAARADQLTLTDAAGVAYQVNHGITYATSSSASGAASEASYTAPVAASTVGGGTSMATLSDAFDGYGALAVATDPAAQTAFGTGNMLQEIYNRTGAAYTLGCDGREMTFPVVASTLIPGLSVSRRVFVPADDSFLRWTEVLENTGATDLTFFVGAYSNLGSDSNTMLFGSSSGDAAASVEDTWVATMQAFAGTSSGDPRLGHVLRGTRSDASVVSTVSFADGDDNPYWWYAVTVPAGATRLLVHYVTPAGNQAAVRTQAAELADMANPSSIACFTDVERGLILNFDAVCPPGREGASCEDGNLCTTGDVCTVGVCVAGAAPECGSGCLGVCEPSTGVCDPMANRPDGTTCDDADACTTGETCAAGACGTGTAVSCDDDDGCTTDTCDAASGCMNTMIAECQPCTTASDCDDSNACNGDETCSSTGMCAPGTVPDCDDGDACTADSCDAAAGCEHDPITTGSCAPDAGAPDAGAPDAGAPDAGAGGGTSSGGCGCRAARSPGAGAGAAGLVALLAATLLARRRR